MVQDGRHWFIKTLSINISQRTNRSNDEWNRKWWWVSTRRWRKRGNQRGQQKRISFILSLKTKNPFIQSCNRNMCFKTKNTLWKKTHEWTVIRYIAGKIRVWLCWVVNLLLFLYRTNLKKTGFVPVTVAWKDLREWGCRRYGCVGSG